MKMESKVESKVEGVICFGLTMSCHNDLSRKEGKKGTRSLFIPPE